jgi:hypothetical protein
MLDLLNGRQEQTMQADVIGEDTASSIECQTKFGMTAYTPLSTASASRVMVTNDPLRGRPGSLRTVSA